MAFYCPRCGHAADAAGRCARDGDVLAPVSSHDLLGRRLGEYTVLASLGGGAFGTVYRAVHARSGMIAAIKLLHRPVDDTGGRVVVEARAAAMIDHANVVGVYDLDLTRDRRPYIVMEHLDGSTLAAALRRGLTVAAALAIAGEVLAGLAAAHAKGVVHRDLKPDNIFVAGDRIVVVDFGLAKLVADPRAPSLTVTGEAIGTPAYMAPEQIRGKPADGRCDLYALACVLFEALAGRPPFAGPSTLALFDAHLTTPPPSIRALRPEVPAHVDAAIRRALAKDPADRFGDARAMWRALTEAPAPARRRWPFAVAGALVVAAIAAGLARSGDESANATNAPAGSDAAVARAPTPAPIVYTPGPPTEPALDQNLQAVLDATEASLARGNYTRAQAVQLRCGLARVAPGTPRGVRAYNRRMAELVDRYFPGIDLAPDCAEPPPRPRRIAMPAQRADEPPLDGSLREALDSIHAQLDGGRLQRAQAVTMLCALYGGRDQARRGGALLAPMRAFYRRYEALLRAYFPDLDAAECR